MKIALITLGCPKNLVDAEVMLGLLDEAGHELTGEPHGADVAVVNTCSFIAAATAESREVVEQCLDLKREGKLGAVVVAGCLPQRYRDDTLRMFPDVDGVVGCSAFLEIPEIIRSVAAGRRPMVVREPTSMYDHRSPRILGTPSHLAYTKISEGCDNRCSYCTIPSIRGRLRSRTPDSIMSEVSALGAMGVREVSIIAQDTTAYGTDIASRSQLAPLLRRLATTGVPWIRLLYTHPAHVDEDILAVMSDEEHVLAYLDLPIQHISDSVLRAMERRTDGGSIRRLMETAREMVPGLAIRSTVMVGFPGESDDDFIELLDFVSAGHVDHLGVFEFSPEEGTPAAALPNQVERAVSRERARAIQESAARLAAERGRRLLGEQVEVLADAPGVGRTRNQAWELDGVVEWEVDAAGAPSPGTIFDAEVTGVRGYDLRVEPIDGGRGRDGESA